MKIVWLTFLWFSPIFLIVTLNFLVDPLGVFGTGLLPAKPEFYKYTRQAKAVIVRRIAPEAVILGESATETGFSTASPFFEGRVCYNFALGAGNYIEMRAHLEHAYVQGRLEQVLIGLDFMEFCRDRDPVPQFSEDRLDRVGVPAKDRGLRNFLISKTATVASLQSLWYRDPNFYDPENLYPLHIYSTETGQRSPLSNSREGHLNSIRREAFVRTLTMASQRVENSHDVDEKNKNMQAFASMIEFCEAHDIDCHVVIQPYHAYVLNSFRELGLFDEVTEFKERIMEITNRHEVPLWDCLLVNDYTSNADLTANARHSSVFFWDTIHFKEELGDKILVRMAQQISDDVAVLISPGDFKEHSEKQIDKLLQFSANLDL